jgi:hypothetical protein
MYGTASPPTVTAADPTRINVESALRDGHVHWCNGGTVNIERRRGKGDGRVDEDHGESREDLHGKVIDEFVSCLFYLFFAFF